MAALFTLFAAATVSFVGVSVGACGDSGAARPVGGGLGPPAVDPLPVEVVVVAAAAAAVVRRLHAVRSSANRRKASLYGLGSECGNMCEKG